jgi:hypothetical protein
MSHTYNESQLTTFLDQISWRLRLIEAQFALMAQQQGIPHRDPATITPAELVDLLVRAAAGGQAPNPSTAAHPHAASSTPAAAAA